MSWLIFDAVLGIVLVLAAVQGYRKGFVLTLCGFLAVFVAFFGASVLSNALAGPVAEAIRPVVEERLEQAMQKSLEEQGWSDGEGEQPEDGSQTPAPEDQFSLEQVLELIQESKLFQSFSGALHSAVSQGLLEVTTSAAQAVAGYLAREVARMALFLICFALVLVGWTMLSRGWGWGRAVSCCSSPAGCSGDCFPRRRWSSLSCSGSSAEPARWPFPARFFKRFITSS